MELATRALGSLITKLGELLKEEYDLHKGLKDEVTSLSNELESAHAALCTVADVPPGHELNKVVKLWSDDVREASYDMEDALDTFLVHVEGCEPADVPHGSKWYLQFKEKIRSLFRKSKDRHKIAVMIKEIKSQVDEMAKRRCRYQVGSDTVPWDAAQTIDPRLTSLYKEVRQFVGIDQPRNDIISLLSTSHRGDGRDASEGEVKVVSVFGVGGLGKTTLAKASYETLKVGFDCWAFVPVGQKPDLKKVLRDILIDLGKQEKMKLDNVAILDERQLIDMLQDFLKNKRYFIVIDDIWDPKSWDIIKLALMKNNHGSRVITTTRIFTVASEASHVYELQRLSYGHSRKLFCTRVFGGEGSCLDGQLDEITNKILKKCDGVPLAIIAMASLLVGKPTEQWPELYSAIGFGNKDNKDVENTMRILSFSYDDLPACLRTCLLYLSAFPEDYVINKDALIWKWIAEGFVDKKQGKGLYEVGEGYFNELINRSMIQAVESSSGCVYGCRVHDMVLELIRSISCEANYVTIINNCEDTQSKKTVRRIAYHNRTKDFSTCVSNMNMEHVRSLIAFKCDDSLKEFVIPFSSFQVLRVLAIEDLGWVDINLKPLGNLLHLRYLGIKGLKNYELPEEIRSLKFRQTLNIYGHSFKGLPSSISLLTQLVCLRTESISSGYDGIGKLTSLEELRLCLDLRKCSINSIRQFFKELGSLKELRVLETRLPYMADEITKSDLMESLRGLHNIRILEVDGANDIKEKEAAGFFIHRNLQHLNLHMNELCRLPSYCINSSRLPYLAHLSLMVKEVDEQDLIALGGLPELQYLQLRIMESTVSVNNLLPGRDGFFKKLRFCMMPDTMIQFLPNEDSSVSFHIWGKNKGDVFFRNKGEMPFGRNKNDKWKIAPDFMPNVEVLEFLVPVRALGHFNFNIADDGLGLEYLSSLEKIRAKIYCLDSNAQEVEMAESDLRLIATHIRPRRPTLRLRREFESDLKKSTDRPGECGDRPHRQPLMQYRRPRHEKPRRPS